MLSSMRATSIGVLLAALAALAFGVTAPVIAWAGKEVGPLATAALLYGGAALAAAVLRVISARSGAGLRARDGGRLALIALSGSVIAPTLLAWGLQHVGATAGALLLNLEAVFTIGLGAALYREPLGGRVLVAMVMMVAGAVTLALSALSSLAWGLWGALAVAGATLAWAIDNTLTRALAERDPNAIVGVKATLGAACTAAAAIAWGEHLPRVVPVVVLVACGATGYGLSLRLYILAQRKIGAARTGSVFALAPFVGAAIAWLAGDRTLGAWSAVAGALFVAGVYLHATEHHHHGHVHDPIDHEHAHRHDDGHHTHAHEPPVAGEHTHVHHHDEVEHEHDHAPDVHHDHSH